VSTATSPEEQQQKDQPGASAKDPRELVEQLRSTQAEEIVAEVFFMLLNAAQVKLGRRDARLMIDLSTVLLEHASSYVSDPLVKQVEQSLAQLRLGQVSAENEVAKKGHAEPNDLASNPTPPAAKR
jgi:hypothetical protein